MPVWMHFYAFSAALLLTSKVAYWRTPVIVALNRQTQNSLSFIVNNARFYGVFFLFGLLIKHRTFVSMNIGERTRSHTYMRFSKSGVLSVVNWSYVYAKWWPRHVHFVICLFCSKHNHIASNQTHFWTSDNVHGFVPFANITTVGYLVII